MIETAVLIAAIVGVTQAIKGVGLPSNFAPFVAIALGVVTMIAFSGLEPQPIFDGVIAGLTAAGLYSGVKAQF